MAKKTKLEVTETQLDEIRAGVALREHDLENAREYLARKDLATTDVEERLKVVCGDGPSKPGLKALLGFRDEPDPDQLSIDTEAESDDD